MAWRAIGNEVAWQNVGEENGGQSISEKEKIIWRSS
jgi:hypothetical protein